jgi:hypothetical protein
VEYIGVIFLEYVIFALSKICIYLLLLPYVLSTASAYRHIGRIRMQHSNINLCFAASGVIQDSSRHPTTVWLHTTLRNQRPHPQSYYFYCSKKAEFARGSPPLLLSGVATVSHPLTEPGVIGDIPDKSVDTTPPLPTRTRIGGGTCLATREAGPLLTARAFGGSPSPRPVPAIGIWIPGAGFCAFLRL